MKTLKRCLAVVLTCMTILATTVPASARASDQIYRYYLDAGHLGGGVVAVDFSVSAIAVMHHLGAERITVTERTDFAWEIVAEYEADDPKMSAYDLSRHGDTIYYYGDVGKEYMVSITIFAEDYSGGYDSRSATFTVYT